MIPEHLAAERPAESVAPTEKMGADERPPRTPAVGSPALRDPHQLAVPVEGQRPVVLELEAVKLQSQSTSNQLWTAHGPHVFGTVGRHAAER